MKSLLNLFSRFKNDQKGVVAIIFAITLIPLMGAAGAAIDYSRAFIVKQRLSSAIDAAALAVGSSSLTDDAALKALGEKYFYANYPAGKLGVPGVPNIVISDKTVTVTATAQLPTSLMGVVGIDNLNVKSSTEVTIEQTNIEVVMVLDNTGSMAGSKISSLKSSANLLVDTLFGSESNHPLLKIGLVPFASSVNVGSGYKNSGWIDVNRKSPIHGVNFQGNTNIFNKLYNRINNKDWNGCVEARSYPMDVNDTAPNSSNGATLWVPYFYPDEPDLPGYNHSYLNDQNNGSAQTRQKKKKKYKNATVNGSGPSYLCDIPPITPLTNSKSTIKNGINSMVASGSTVIPIGMAWGWRVISPGEPFTEGAAYNDPDNPTLKAIVLLSDGSNWVGNLSNHNKSYYNGYGYVATSTQTNRLNVSTGSAAQDRLDERLEEVCENAKGQGIVVFTVAFQISDSSTRTLMENCASSSEYYFDASNSSSLQTAFKNIGNELSELRLSK